MYAVLDIETTGGKYNQEGITEIAIYKFDGTNIIETFTTLINPEKPIQPFVINLTKISNKTVKDAPKFYEVAKKIIEITTDCILVAHDTSVDYRIIKNEYKRLGFDYLRKTLCTVALSKKILPEETHYNLGKLCKSLGIPLTKRHRADGDALATLELLKILLAKDFNKEIINETTRKPTPIKKWGKRKPLTNPLP